MSNINRVIFSGNVVRDAELAYVGAGQTALCKFSVANNQYMGSGKDDYVSYVDCSLWGKRAEALNQYLVKGTGVVCEAQFRQERWSKDGNNRSKITFNIQSLEFKGGKGKQGGQDGGSYSGQQGNQGDSQGGTQDGSQGGPSGQKSGEQGGGQMAEFEDDIPFSPNYC